ncbi:MAG: sugar nucleotide-binding protein [Nitrospira sp.]|nr:sugar nucleotide-binding protein [Nitrospira sp.]
MTTRVVITGASGLIGRYVMTSAARWAPGWEVHGLTRADLDLTDQAAVERIWQRIDPHAVIHCAALSRTKDCEHQPELRCRAAKSGKSLTLYTDEFRCPLPAGVIARAVWEVAGKTVPGLYHLGGRERLSRWDIGQALLPWYPELQGRLVEGSARSHAGAPRPADLSLNCEKIQTVLSFPIPGFRSWLEGRMHRDTDLWDYEPGVPLTGNMKDA